MKKNKKLKNFIIKNLFKIVRPKKRSLNTYSSGNVPFVASGNFNNGIVKFCKPKKYDQLDKGGCISVSPVDGSTFYQECDFLGRGGGGSSIILLYNNKLDKYNGYYISTVIRAVCSKYKFNDMGNSDNIKDEEIPLPVTSNGEPDYKYMSNYMKNIIEILNLHFKQIIKLSKLDEHYMKFVKTKSFRIDELFDIHPTRAYKDTNATLMSKYGKNPVVVNSMYNNGIGGYTEKDNTEKGNIITFSDTTSAEAIFYQPDDFVGYPHVQGMYPKKMIKEWDKYTYLYFLVLFKKKALTLNFDFVNKFNRDIVKDIRLQLPVNNKGDIDFNYMRLQMKKVLIEKSNQFKILYKLF